MAQASWKAEQSAALEREYNLRQAFPDYEQFFADWRRRSAAARTARRAVLDISYGEGPRRKLDLFPARDHKAPLLVFIHGGYWRSMDRTDFSFLAEPLVARGISVAIPSYPLCPEATLDEIVDAAQAALTYVKCENIHLAGWSAGAHLATMLLTRSQPRKIRSVLALSGLYDLRPLRHVSVNEDLRLDPVAAARNSPLLLRPEAATRLAVVAGALETPALRKQSRDFAEAWKAPHSEIPDVHHYAIISALGDERTALFGQLLEQISAQ